MAALFFLFKKSNQTGSILLPAAIVIGLLFSATTGFFHIAVQAQNLQATRNRLDFCALRIVRLQTETLNSIARLNQRLRNLRRLVYTARLASLYGPARLAAQAAAKTALRTMHAISIHQKTVLATATVRQTPLFRCRQTKFSGRQAYCRFSFLSAGAFTRTKTLFKDVPGDLRRRRPNKKMTVHCLIVSRQTILSRFLHNKLQITGDRKLLLENYRHEYGQ